MTSSLVGSEMCIRDRKTPVRLARKASMSSPRCLGENFRHSSGHTPGLVAVSYTHLTLPTICSV
eukprot:9571771-Prorocentrum_lima.AAC.1